MANRNRKRLWAKNRQNGPVKNAGKKASQRLRRAWQNIQKDYWILRPVINGRSPLGIGMRFAAAAGMAVGVAQWSRSTEPEMAELKCGQIRKVQQNLRELGHFVAPTEQCFLGNTSRTALIFEGANPFNVENRKLSIEFYMALENRADASRNLPTEAEVLDAIDRASAVVDLGSPDEARMYLINKVAIESRFDPNAEHGSVRGLLQFKPQTFLSALYKHGEEYGFGELTRHVKRNSGRHKTVYEVDDPQIEAYILNKRFDPYVASVLALAEAKNFKARIDSKYGIKSGPAHWYFGHLLGNSGGDKFVGLLQGEQTKAHRVIEHFRREIVDGNPQVFSNRYATIEGSFSKIAMRFRNVPGQFKKIEKKVAQYMSVQSG